MKPGRRCGEGSKHAGARDMIRTHAELLHETVVDDDPFVGQACAFVLFFISIRNFGIRMMLSGILG